MPYTEQFGISRKIEDPKERLRLRKIVQKLAVPEGMGIIMRTIAQGTRARHFVRDLHMLLEQWDEIEARRANNPAPACIFQEPGLIERTARDFLTDEIDQVICDDCRHHGHDPHRRRENLPPRQAPHPLHALRRRPADFRTHQHPEADRRSILPPGLAQVRRLHRHRRDRGAHRHRRQHRPQPRLQGCGQDDSRNQRRGRRRSRPPAPPAQHRRTGRHRLHRHAPPQGPADGLQGHQGAAQARQGQDPGAADFPRRPDGNDPPAPQRIAAGFHVRALPVLPGPRAA